MDNVCRIRTVTGGRKDENIFDAFYFVGRRIFVHIFVGSYHVLSYLARQTSLALYRALLAMRDRRCGIM